MSTLMTSWVETANDPSCPFPLNNLPCGVFSTAGRAPRCGVAIGSFVLDVAELDAAGDLDFGGSLGTGRWNNFMALDQPAWRRLRDGLQAALATGNRTETFAKHLVPLSDVTLHMPFDVTEYTDFYASRHHATNVGTMFRGAENALPPNWLHIPIGYNGRASSVVVSGTDINRPWGQIKPPSEEVPRFAPSAKFDIELELGAVVGTPSKTPLSVAAAHAAIFGYVLLNDWSARDIQAWEYQPLGPFQSKATATSISPWIVTALALEPFLIPVAAPELPLLPHLQECSPTLYSIDLEVGLAPSGGGETLICRTNYREMYYSAAQQLAHHTACGCPMRTGDLLGSGTISGPKRDNRGSLLEISWGGKEPITLDCGSTRSFIEDGDKLTLRGEARGDGYRIGFGECAGTLLPARPWGV